MIRRSLIASKMAVNKLYTRFLLVVIISAKCLVSGLVSNKTLWPCDNIIFCQGKLLHTVQMARLFNDSKTFVDMRMKNDSQDVLRAFAKLGPTPDRRSLMHFLNENFELPEHDLESWTSPDWREHPSFVDEIADKNLKQFGLDLNRLWKKLGRKISTDARSHPNRSSLILVDKPFIVPGGRFREFYYWDTFWTVEGLLVCQIFQTVRLMITNFVQLVKQFGFVPNGGRIYYLNRSQPPFLIPIVSLYLNATKDFEFVKTILPFLETEYEFWNAKRSVQVNISGTVYTLNRYSADMNTPRPESYYEDVHTASGLPAEKKAQIYRDLASAAESGWDFSTRWFQENSKNIKTIRTRKIIPVDLNAYLYRNEITLEAFYKQAKDTKKAEKYRRLATTRRQAMEAVFWSEDKGRWLDYDIETNSKRSVFYASEVVPLWAGLHQGNVTRDKLVVHSLVKMKVLDYVAGVPTSLVSSGQQWDFPNAWAPLQYICQEGMANSPSEILQKFALKLAQKWIKTNYRAWNATKHMFEKYDARIQGTPGGGGEYDTQVGFGWTNGVALHVLKRYPKQLKAMDENITSDAANVKSGKLIHYLIRLLVVFLTYR